MNSTSDRLLMRNTSTNDITITTMPMDSVSVSWAGDGRRKMRADISDHVDSVQVE